MKEENIASMKKRVASFAIDDIIISIFFIIIFYNQFAEIFSNIKVVDEVAIAMMNSFIAQNIFVVLALKLLYHTLFIWQNGATLGKLIMKIKVVDIDTERTPSLHKAFLRSLLRIPSELLFYLGFILAYFMPLKQTFHDKISNCVVVDG